MTTGRLYPISPSKLGTWLDCPRKFFLQYVERQRVSGSWAHLSMGNAIHNALRGWFDEPMRRLGPAVRIAAGEAIDNLIDRLT